MGPATTAAKEHQRRDRLREYDAALASAQLPVAVMALFVQAREARAGGLALEEGFAAAPVEGVDVRLPPAVWVALRQGDVDATIEALVRGSRQQFLIAEREELNAGYRLTTVAERRGLPDVELLLAQLGAFLQIPPDVIAVVAAWGPDDPRTADEVDRLVEQRFGADQRARPTAVGSARAALAMSSSEFGALLNLAPQQRAVLATLVRQSDITITIG
jgi:hypothetical protein